MKTVIGIDYGTQAARALLVNVHSGEVLASHAVRYPHGVMAGDLASTKDYEDALMELLGAVTPEKYRHTVSGLCVDATSLTLVPLSSDGRVLCQLPGLEQHPHAQIKLWKRHTAQRQADEALELARKMKQPFLGRTGGSVSSEWTLPKVLEMRDEAPEVYAQMDLALDLCEFLTYRLTGKVTRSAGAMGFKGLWARDLGLPEKAYLDALRPGFADEYARLMRGNVARPGESVGRLSMEMCKRFGLPQDAVVATGVLDGHTALLALGTLQDGDGTLVLGTSGVLSIQTEKLYEIEGICGITLDGVTSGLYGIDAGQNCTGDMLEWYVNHMLPRQVLLEAESKGVSPHELLCSRISRPWENTVMAVDRWNGSRNAPCDLSLAGAFAGLRLSSRPEDLYLALLQSIVCGTREIIECCAAYGLEIRRLVATGGIAIKNPLLMQEYANFLHMPVQVGQVTEGPALGSAMLAATAAGFYQNPLEASRTMGVHEFLTYEPDESHYEDYERLYRKNHALRMMTAELEHME